MKNKKIISIVGGCYNEAENIEELYNRCRAVLDQFPQYDYEFVLADNRSTDGTREVLRNLAARDPKFRVILNANNYGHIRSPFNAFLATRGDATVIMCTDLQDPPELIADFIREWENGCKVAIAVRSDTQCGFAMETIRKFYYCLLAKFAPDEHIIQGFTGFGLYDRKFVDAVRKYHDPYPYFRGLVSEIGFSRVELPFVQPKRKHGITKNNFFTLYDMAMTGFVNHTKLPLRLAVFAGVLIGMMSLLTAIAYLVLKLVFWNTFSFGMAPLMIGMFFFSAVQLIFIGIIGEYLGAVWTQVKNRPLVIEDERLNFDQDETNS